ncbi:MAG: phage capsid protein [Clostridium sp.]|nr:phage capsid protein [Clostridium sp.]
MREHLKNNPELRRNKEREKATGVSREDILKSIQTLKEIEKNAKIEEIRNKIKTGEQPLNIEEGKQGKHIKGHNNYIEGRSYLTISTDEAQELVNKYAGTGEIRLKQNGEWDNKEIIEVDKNIGVNVNNRTNESSPTNKFKVHYSKKGVHIVPTKKE